MFLLYQIVLIVHVTFQFHVERTKLDVVTKAEILYIIPTGILYKLPFEILYDGSSYLIEKNAISYLSSASLLKILRKTNTKTSAKYPLLAFANPCYSNKNLSYFENDINEMSFIDLRTKIYLKTLGGNFKSLFQTKHEVQAIKKIFNPPEYSHPLQLQENASRSKFLELNKTGELVNYRYIVFSCHGVLIEDTNMISQPALVLSQPDPISKKNEYLTMSDIFGVKMNAELVTLSACNSGRGDNIKGEGITGLIRAFMYSGAKAVSVTLWPVSVDSEVTLNIGFYKNLKKGMKRSKSLQYIKKRMIKGYEGEIHSHPFFWASTVIFGEG